MPPRYARKKDNNHPLIVQTLETAGYTVVDVSSMGSGVLDLICVSKSGIPILMEVKNPEYSYGKKLNENEQNFWDRYPGPKCVVRDPEDALAVMNRLDNYEIVKTTRFLS